MTLTGALLMSLASPGCSDADRDLPREYQRMPVHEDRLGDKGARERGRMVFLMNCAICHGERGDGLGTRREGLVGRPRDFTTSAWRTTTSPRRVVFAIREGLTQTSMPAWPTLTDDEVWDVTAYVLSLGERR
jgi:mono/diheme cytochrome c family protein